MIKDKGKAITNWVSLEAPDCVTLILKLVQDDIFGD